MKCPKCGYVIQGDKESEALAESVYKHYPRKVGKKVGIKKLAALLRKDPGKYEQILNYVQKYKQAVIKKMGKDLKYVPHFSTWVEQERWEDQDSWVVKEIPREPKPPCQRCENGFILAADSQGRLTTRLCSCRQR